MPKSAYWRSFGCGMSVETPDGLILSGHIDALAPADEITAQVRRADKPENQAFVTVTRANLDAPEPGYEAIHALARALFAARAALDAVHGGHHD